MKSNHLDYQIALTLLDGVGAKSAKTLLAYTGSEENIFDKKFDIKTKIPGFAKERFRNLDRKSALEKAKPIIEFVEKHNIGTSFFTSKEYSKRLKECPDAPVLLYHKGEFDYNARKNVAIVGTRNMTSYGRKLINELLKVLSEYDVQVISGLALGVDGYAHSKCIEYGIPTLGVLGHGLDRIYPGIHKNLAKRMINTPGCGLITEFPNGTNPDRENFPQRNRIVAGMSDATIVIESGSRGGSLITAYLANDYNRDVFAYPGNIDRPFSKGCNQLISENKAHLITSGDDFVRLMGWEKKETSKVRQMSLFDGLEGEELKIAKTIQESKQISLDNLSVKLQKPVGLLSSLLLMLELKGIVMTLPGKNYTLA